ncbi:hypothetical protein H1D32_06055 [Anaerobacillus sp. CMMVII]|uniref:hypothetical protein n=1 Tax=Anaerobacillus sp. CMMVII TaxID=2755588 RepID=UPI0021B774A1|nr:hypothetical protein [Anaerobacillus sp. CMMVII]MCT8137346.1 hypothetical protein [Anaerobacillus sp. CMMVII]
MKGSYLTFILIVLACSGCNGGNFQGQMDTPLEYSQFTEPVVNEYEYKQLIGFLYEAELMMRKPIEEATMNADGIKYSQHQFKRK